jgi:hypothetical protein
VKSFITCAAISTVLIFSPQAFAGKTYSPQQCKAWFNKVDRNNDGSIGEAENSEGFLARITLASESDSKSGTFIMSQRFFVDECAIGSLGKPQ